MYHCGMTSPAMAAAATVIAPPCRSTADATHEHGLIFRVATSTSSGQATAADIPANCRGRYWRLLVKGPDANTPVDLEWAWLCDEDGTGTEDTAPTLVYGQTSATGTGNAAAAQSLLDRQPEHVWCPPNARGVVFIASAATGTFAAHVSGSITATAR